MRVLDSIMDKTKNLFDQVREEVVDIWRGLDSTGKFVVTGCLAGIALILMMMLSACGPIQTGGSGDQHITNQTIITTSVNGSASSASSGGAATGGTTLQPGETYSFNAGSKTDWSSGTITFSLTGLGFDMLPPSGDCVLFLARFFTPSGAEGNFHFNIASLVPRLTSQRFDGTCSPWCDRQAPGSVAWVSTDVYTFSAVWDSATVSLIIRDSSSKVVFSGSVQTDGAYAGEDWIGVTNALVSNTITVIDPVVK